MWAIVPVKQFELAKGRLADVLSSSERAELARAMLEDVLEQLSCTRGVDVTLVVTREAEVAALARRAGARIVAERGTGLNDAVRTAADVARAGSATGILVVHGDLPLARAEDLEAVIAAHGATPSLTIAPDDVHDGSNCLAVSPPDLVPFAFGQQSFDAHCAAARARGLTATVVERDGLALDIDRVEDLQALCATEAPGRAVAFLRASGIASRIREATAIAAGAGDARTPLHGLHEDQR